MIKKDVELIKSYIKRHNWTMQQTESGLWYQVIKEGNGMKAQNDMLVTLKYRVELLDGTLCYTSDSTGYKEVLIGAGKAESGLEEGLLFMHLGGEARFILPPHLAYGLSGDNKQIPPRSILVYQVTFVSVAEGKDARK